MKLIFALIVVVLITSGWFYSTKTQTSNTPQPTPQPSAAPSTTEGLTPPATPNPPAPAPAAPTTAQPGPILDLSNQNLTRVPEYVFGRTNLHTLDLSYNKLTGSLQAEVRKLSALRVLDMSHNAFTGVPAEVGQLAQLEMLDLSYNKLTGLPYELGNLKNLKTLDLRGNAYAPADLEMIKKGLPASTQVLID